MPIEITLRGPAYSFRAFGLEEAKAVGLVDAFRRPGTHAPISTSFGQGEGKMLYDWVNGIPDAVLVVTGRYELTVFRPKHRLKEVPEEEGAGEGLEGILGDAVPGDAMPGDAV